MTGSRDIRIEKDFLGELDVPNNVYWGINTQRAILNFQISHKKVPPPFILALAQVKKACLLANRELGLIDEQKGDAMLKALSEIIDQRKFLDQFPIDVYQTGSGTQTNMNMNEVIANRANEILGYPMGKKTPVHPNDHVNKSQSSNDVIPTTMHVATIQLIQEKLIPAVSKLRQSLKQRIKDFRDIIKVGRTHLQDAVPIPLSLEFEVYDKQLEMFEGRIKNNFQELVNLPIGGTALGTGIDAPKDFAERATTHLSQITKIPFQVNPVKAEGIASHNVLVHVSGTLRLLALSLIKMANDIRWMGSGPRAGLGELILPPNEPGSSIMPGKVNPTQNEALIQVCLQVIGNDSTILLGEEFGSILDMNMCKPLILSNLFESIEILTGGINSFEEHCLRDLQANNNHIKEQLEKSLMLVTNLVPVIGYDKATEIASIANKTGKTIREIIIEKGIKIKENLDALLDPRKMI